MQIASIKRVLKNAEEDMITLVREIATNARTRQATDVPEAQLEAAQHYFFEVVAVLHSLQGTKGAPVLQASAHVGDLEIAALEAKRPTRSAVQREMLPQVIKLLGGGRK